MARRGRKPGSKIVYNPIDTAKYRSQWSRYQKGLGLPFVQVSDNRYDFPSDRSVRGFWTVDRELDVGGGSWTPGPGPCPGGVLPPLPSPPAATSAMMAIYACWSRPGQSLQPGLGGFLTLVPRSMEFSGHIGFSDWGQHRYYGVDTVGDGEVTRDVYIYYASYSAGVSPSFTPFPWFSPASPPWTLVSNYPIAGTDPGFFNPGNGDPGLGWCNSDPGGGGGGGGPGPWRCNCPDYARKHDATGRWPSESRDRDWSASNAGSGSIAGDQQPCKHLIAVRLARGDAYAVPRPGDWREMEDWKRYAGDKSRERWAKRRKRRAADRRQRLRDYRTAEDRAADVAMAAERRRRRREYLQQVRQRNFENRLINRLTD